MRVRVWWAASIWVVAALQLPVAADSALANVYNVGGGTITASSPTPFVINDQTAAGFGWSLSGVSSVTVDIEGVTLHTTANGPPALGNTALDINTNSYQVTVHGTNLSAVSPTDGFSLFLQSVNNSSLDTRGGTANQWSSGLALITSDKVTVQLGADVIGGSSGTGIDGQAVEVIATDISLDMHGTQITSNNNGIEARGGYAYPGHTATHAPGTVTIGADGGLDATITTPNGYGIWAYNIADGVVSVTLGSSGTIVGAGGIYINSLVSKQLTVDTFGSITASGAPAINSVNQDNSAVVGNLIVTLESGSTTNGLIQFQSDGTNVFNIMTGANIAATTFSGVGGGTGTAVIDLKGAGAGAFDVSTANGITLIAKDDSGTWTLTRSGSAGAAAAPIAVHAGTLTLGTPGISGAVAVDAAGTLAFDTAGTYSNVISGAGAIEKSGAGTVVLTANSPFSGTTHIEGGTLQLGAGGTSGALGGTFIDDSILVFDRSDVLIQAGAIGGSGALTQAGSGTLILTGSNTYSGGTTISAGTLQIGNGATAGSIAGDVTDNGTLVFDRSDSIAFAGLISGVGMVHQDGNGVLTLGAVNTYSGGTSVDAGTLNVTGAIGSVSVASGATLTGTGTVGSANITGTLRPGAGTPPGTLAVQGNLVFASGATYAETITPSAANLTTVTGTASLGGTVNVDVAPGSYPISHQYTLLTAAGGISGSFASLSVVGLSPALNAHLSYDAGDVFLDLAPNALAPQLGANATTNQMSVAAGIDSAVLGGAVPPAGFGVLYTLSGPALDAALDEISGLLAPDLGQAAGRSFTVFLGQSVDRGTAPGTASDGDSGAPKPARLDVGVSRLWGSIYGGHAGLSADPVSGAAALDSDTIGFAGGVESRLSDRLVAGISAGFGHEDFSAANGRGRSSDTMLALYAHQDVFDRGYVSVALGYGWHGIGTRRVVTLSGTDVLVASLDAVDIGGRVEAGYKTTLDEGVILTPFLAVQASRFYAPSYSETTASGASTFAVSYAAQDNSLTQGELGARLRRDFWAGDSVFSLQGLAAWAHEWDGVPVARGQFVALAGSGFVLDGARPASDTALLGLDVSLRRQSGLTLGISLNGQTGAGTDIVTGTAHLAFDF